MVNCRNLNRLLCACLCLGMLLVPEPVAAQRTTICIADVIVQAGDSLSAIAIRNFGASAAYTQIVEATNAQSVTDPTYARIENPELLQIGWKLCIPPTQNSSRPSTVPAVEANALIAGLSGAVDPAQIRALAIPTMRARTYPGSPILIEQTLIPGTNYNRYIVSYRSDGLKIFALMTVPTTNRPTVGWPVIVFNHGYIPPELYRSTERYEAHVDALARNGYLVFRPDLRGHGTSGGSAAGGYTGPAYTVDVLNAVAAVRLYADADPARIGMWGHSLGGLLTLRSMVIDEQIKAGVIWSGVVVAVPELLSLLDFSPVPVPAAVFRFREQLFEEFGTPQTNPTFWDAISPNAFLDELAGPLQLHHGTGDRIVPMLFSTLLNGELVAADQDVELFTYAGDDHNLTRNFDTAMARTVRFFDEHVKDQ